MATKGDVTSRANTRIRDRANSGLSWGTNNYPAGSLVGWFGGTTAGLTAGMNAGGLSGGTMSAANVIQRLREFTNTFARLRRMRITIAYGNNSGEDFVNSWDDIQYDGTAYGFSATAATPAGGGQAAISGIKGALRIADIDNTVNNMYNAYVTHNRNNTISLYNRVCHTSCHDNCHCARGRR